MSSKFFKNTPQDTLINRFERIFASNVNLTFFDVVVGFLRASGYFRLRPFLNNIQRTRVLVGINTDKYIQQAHARGRLLLTDPKQVKAQYLHELNQDISDAPYDKELEEGILQFAKDIAEGRLELRVHNKRKIHAKFYILHDAQDNPDSLSGAVITGSSNLTAHGLGITNRDEYQYELNVCLRDHDDIAFARREFEELWAEAQDCSILPVELEQSIKKTYLNDTVTPYQLYMKVLIEYFGEATLDEHPDFLPEGINFYEYQRDAVLEGFSKLKKYDGFFLADVVGLGKTIIATMIAKKFIFENGHKNTRVLVVHPPTLKLNWETTFKRFGIDKHTKFITNGSLDKVLSEDAIVKPEEFDLILVDEAHKFRNHDTKMFKSLQEICKSPRSSEGKTAGRKKVVLISATPFNNRPEDLYYQIQLFQDARRTTIDGISNLTSFFGPLILRFKEAKRGDTLNLPAIKAIAEELREKLMNQITIRRTRTDIESVPRYTEDVEAFPKVLPPHILKYQFTEAHARLFHHTMWRLLGEGQLNFSRYQAIAALNDESLFEKANVTAQALARMMQIMLVKRLESSFHAFKISIKRFQTANRNMIKMFEKGQIFIAPDLNVEKFYQDGLTDEEILERVLKAGEDNPKNAVFTPADFEPAFLPSLNHDQAILDELAKSWRAIPDEADPKLAFFLSIFDSTLLNPESNPSGKLVIFTESKDTADYLSSRLNRKDLLNISAQNRTNHFKTILANFDANLPREQQKDEIRIIISTEVLGEGVNLHRSNHVIHYDTPWNAIKLMQRIGRVNRIGSIYPTIHNYVFYPSALGDNEINLINKSFAKLQTFHILFGEDSKIYSPDEEIPESLTKLFKIATGEDAKNPEIEHFEAMRTLFDADRKQYNTIKALPLKSRTARAHRTVDTTHLHNATLVFLRNATNHLFFALATEQGASTLTPVRAFNYFQADSSEDAVMPLIPQHHDHIQSAISKFSDSIFENDGTAVASVAKLPPNIAKAKKFLHDLLNSVPQEMSPALTELIAIVERGTYTHLPKEIASIQTKARKKAILLPQIIEEIAKMIAKYVQSTPQDTDEIQDLDLTPTVILSESFH